MRGLAAGGLKNPRIAFIMVGKNENLEALMQEQQATGWRSSDLGVVLSGLLTTAVVLFFISWLGRQIKDFEIMGWYWLFVIPVGAILVGIGAGSGYGFMSWRTGRKITGNLLGMIVALLALAFAAAQWVEFKSLNLEHYGVDFFKYFDTTTRGMTFKLMRSHTSTGSLGILGYLFRLLELAGFSLGGLFIPIMLRAKPYCESCQTYMQRGSRWWLTAAAPMRKISKKDPVAMTAWQREMEDAHKKGIDLLNNLVAALRERDTTSFRSILEQNGVEVKAANKLLESINLTLHSCVHCRTGVLEMELRAGMADKTKITPLGREWVSSGFIAALGDVRPLQRAKTV
jgi:hypothetical protein